MNTTVAFTGISSTVAEDGGETHSSPAQALLKADRSLPRWAGFLSTIFTAGVSLCLLSVAVLSVFLQAIVADGSSTFAIWLLLAFGSVPVVGAVLLSYAHEKALAGFRGLRTAHAVRTEAMVAGLVCLVLLLIHPALAAGHLLSALVAIVGTRALARKSRREPHWDFNREEAVALLAGHDHPGFSMASDSPRDHALQPGLARAAAWLGVLVSLAVSSWLATIGYLNPSAVLAVALMTHWSASAVSAYASLRTEVDPHAALLAAGIEEAEASPDASGEGLNVSGLTVRDANERHLLDELRFSLAPGTMLGVMGSSGAGKSLLLQALVAPQDMGGLRVRGSVRLNGLPLWQKQTADRPVQAVHLSQIPLILPASGIENLACFHEGAVADQARRLLEQLTHSVEATEQICSVRDATLLSAGQKKTLAFARAFLISPQLYLLDRPEDLASETLVRALLVRLRQESRMGRVIVIVTENRVLLDACDKILVLQDGRNIDFGDAQEIRAKMSSGWSRFQAGRTLEAEDNLLHWVRGLFKRDGDEGNRRAVSIVASELLAFSCQSRDGLAQDTVSFEFKHFEGYGLLRMTDDSVPLSTAQIQRARDEVTSGGAEGRLSPLASVVTAAEEVTSTVEQDRRVITARIATYDPRKPTAPKAGTHAIQRR